MFLVMEGCMKPQIKKTKFGMIKIEDEVYEHDVIIRLNGDVKKRKKKLSKSVYGTSHTMSADEAQHIYEEGAKRLIVGTGQEGMLTLSDEALDFFKNKSCAVDLLATPESVQAWNSADGAVIGVFHITC
jgi:hypothetical protein